MLTVILESHGYVVVQAVDGEDAVRTYSEHKDEVKLVVIDVVMPGKNGGEALDEIAQIDPLIRALFVSGYTGDIVIDKGVRSDSVDFVQKPVSVPTLLKKVREVLDR
jgi:CheY-like chemotaxis protein